MKPATEWVGHTWCTWGRGKEGELKGKRKKKGRKCKRPVKRTEEQKTKEGWLTEGRKVQREKKTQILFSSYSRAGKGWREWDRWTRTQLSEQQKVIIVRFL